MLNVFAIGVLALYAAGSSRVAQAAKPATLTLAAAL
jgi:hypothetical protein